MVATWLNEILCDVKVVYKKYRPSQTARVKMLYYSFRYSRKLQNSREL